ncbi:MAG: ABC transporter permease [Thermoproteales archaeon]|nr:ABC transporter permease [Thermoproteales archaeon]
MRLGGGASFLSTSLLKVLRELCAAAYVGVRIYLRYPMWILSDLITSPLWAVVILLPILLFLPPEAWGSGVVAQNFFWGMVLWYVVSTSLMGIGSAVRSEQQMGTLEQLLLTNANRAVLFTRRLAFELFSLTLNTAYMYVFVQLLFGKLITVENPLLVLLVLAAAMAIAVGFGLIYGTLILWIKNPGALSNILQFVIMGLSGIFYSIRGLPAPLQYVSYALPFTYVADLLRHEAMDTPTLLPLHLEYLLVAALAVALNAAGYLAILHVEKRLKRTGKLGVY